MFDGRSENKRRGIKAKVDCGVPINLFKLANALSNSNLNQSARKKIRDLYPIERRLSLFDVTSLFSSSSLFLSSPSLVLTLSPAKEKRHRRGEEGLARRWKETRNFPVIFGRRVEIESRRAEWPSEIGSSR